MKILKYSIYIFIFFFCTKNIIAKTTEEFKNYSNKLYNFTILLPKKWKHTEMKNKDEFIVTVTKDKYTSINLSVSPIKKKEDWLKYPYSKINKDSVKILESDLDTTKNKIVGKIIVFEYKHDKQNILLRSYVIKYDKYVMLVECRSTIDNFFDYNDVFNQVMSSFKRYDSVFEIDLPGKLVYHRSLTSNIKITYNDRKKNKQKTYKSKIEQQIEIGEQGKGYEYIAKHNKVEVLENDKKIDEKLNDILTKTNLTFTVDKYGHFTHVTGYKDIKDRVKDVYPLYKEKKAYEKIEEYIIFFIAYESLINTSKIINRVDLKEVNSFFTVFTYQNPVGEHISCYTSVEVKDIIKVFGREYIRINYYYNTDPGEFAKDLKVDKKEVVESVGYIENKFKDIKYYINGRGVWIFDPEEKIIYSDKGKRKIKYSVLKGKRKNKKERHDFEIDEEIEITNISIKDDK